jgi:hypothetical protein
LENGKRRIGNLSSVLSGHPRAAVVGDYVLAASSSGIWRRPISQITSYAERPSPQLSNGFSLGKSFQNPFNPTTAMSYDPSKNGYVTFKAYDALDREIRTLVRRYELAGKYTVSFDAAQLPSGIFFFA